MQSLIVRLLLFSWNARQGFLNYQPPSPPPMASPEKASSLAVITLLAGISAWTIFPFVGGVVGIITGWMELKNIKAGTSSSAGQLITQLGLGASIANVALTILGLIGFALMFLFFGAAALSLGAAGAAAQ